jgi:hypothetical protein
VVKHHQQVLGINQAKTLKVLMTKGVAGTKDPVLMLKLVAGGTKEQVWEMEAMLRPGINQVLLAEVNHLVGVNLQR